MALEKGLGFADVKLECCLEGVEVIRVFGCSLGSTEYFRPVDVRPVLCTQPVFGTWARSTLLSREILVTVDDRSVVERPTVAAAPVFITNKEW